MKKIIVEITKEDIQKYPNDAELGKYLRKKFLKVLYHDSNI